MPEEPPTKSLNLCDRRGCTRRSRIAALLLAALFLPAIAEPTAKQRPGFEATVARVRVDVIVTDDSGQFVDDLEAENFVVLEDGQVQSILDLQMVDLAAGTVKNLVAGGSTLDAAATRTELSVEVETRETVGQPRNASNLGAMIFLVDLPGMDWRNKARFATAWGELLANTDRLGIARAVYLIPQTGRLRELTPLTFDVARLRQAVDTVRLEPLVRKSIHDQLASGGRDPSARTDLEERARTRRTLELLTEFCNALAARRGRTALVWITSELQLTQGGPAGALATARGGTNFDFMMSDPGIQSRQRALHQAANSANVSIYTLDPTPAYELQGLGFDVEVRDIRRSAVLNSPEVKFSLDGLRDGLRDAAEETGGKAFIHWSDIGEALEAIDQDSSRYYLLTYANPVPHGDGQYHEIHVEVRGRPGLAIRARGGYVDLPPDERRRRTLAGALGLPGALSENPLAARAFRRWSPEGHAIVQIAVRLAGATGGETARPGEVVGDMYELHALAVNDRGDIVSEINEEVRPRVQGAETYTYVRDWPLDPGAYDLHLVIEDVRDGQLSATRLQLDVPKAATDWQTSDLMLVTSDDNQEAVPLMTDEVQNGDDLAAYLEVLGGQQPVLTGDLFDAAGTSRLMQFPRKLLESSGDGIHRGALRLQGVPRGDYTLQILVSDPATQNHRVFRMPLRVTRPRED